MSLGTLVALSEGSSLTPTRRVVLSFIPSLYSLFASFYSGRMNVLNVGSTIPAFLFVHHAALLAGVLLLNLSVPGWVLDAPLWMSSISSIFSPTSAMQTWGVDTAKTTVTDKILYIFQGHADLVYAAAIRASLSLSSGDAVAVELMKWSWTAWCASIIVFYALRADLTKLLTATTASRLMGPMAFLATARLHLSTGT
jgi:hypothetical protein